ncbi:putative mediator of RNA polymerase II transcription subunit 26 isoform X2 [Puntigrus tetrazona]|uniref:putative mediator of RNA polymerase II transcription subunit 26 isoform X2 n=1 Tax=Puntigrus tetrazona TaxID=1606681 RepID=UPI001C8A0EE6|nr:putative mediator of RNA polymerase II transcription subunit 26 isoform X2 [Puntigrus tetrazona]
MGFNLSKCLDGHNVHQEDTSRTALQHKSHDQYNVHQEDTSKAALQHKSHDRYNVHQEDTSKAALQHKSHDRYNVHQEDTSKAALQHKSHDQYNVHQEDTSKAALQQTERRQNKKDLEHESQARHDLETHKRGFDHFQASKHQNREELNKTSAYQYKEELEKCKEQLKKKRDELEQYKNSQHELQARDQLKGCKKLIEDELQERHELEQCKRDLENLQASEYQCKEELKQTRQELDQCKKDLERFQARMAFEASVDMGSSGASCEDLNNPCRESELRKMYDKLRLQKLSKHIMDIKMKSKKDKTISETNEKERLKAMLKEIFDKAQQDMSKRKKIFILFPS